MNAVRTCLQRIPPELVADIVDTRIVLTGGGALLRRLESELRGAPHLPIRIGSEPAPCAVLGGGRAMEQPTLLTAISVSPKGKVGEGRGRSRAGHSVSSNLTFPRAASASAGHSRPRFQPVRQPEMRNDFVE